MNLLSNADGEVGTGYSFDEVQPLLAGLVEAPLRRFPKLAEDINQAALLGAWEATGSGTASFERIAELVKRRVAETVGELADRKREACGGDVNLQTETDAEYSGRGYNANKAIRDFDSLPDNEKRLLQRCFRDYQYVNDAADECGVERGQALRLYRKYKAILADRVREHD